VVRSHERTILVYDLGGGTFDVAVMAVERGRLRVLASAGDTFLGGDDFDAAIVDRIRQRFAREYHKHLSQDPQTVALLKARAESAKKRLSSCHTTMFTARQVRLIGGAKERIELEISRAEVEEAVCELVTRTLAITTQATQEARVKPSQIADVLLVGGQTRMPFVRYAVARHFGIEPRSDLNPDEVVAFGAGLFAHLPRGKTSAFQDVLAMSIGIGVGQRFQPLLKRNTPVPCSSALTFKVPRSAFAQASIALWQGDEPELYRNEKLGMLRVDVMDPGDVDPVPLRVDLALSPDCLLRLTMQNLATGEMRHVLLNTRDGVE
jgi:molecular chaperone DnaK